MKTIYIKPKDAERRWFIIDAQGEVLGRVAVKAASVARGKTIASYVPYHELGGYIVIINAGKAKLTGKKIQNKLYYRHSGYVGSLKVQNYTKLLARRPTAPMEKAVRGMLPRGPLGNKIYKNIKIYAGSSHPHEAQKPEILKIQES